MANFIFFGINEQAESAYPAKNDVLAKVCVGYQNVVSNRFWLVFSERYGDPVVFQMLTGQAKKGNIKFKRKE